MPGGHRIEWAPAAQHDLDAILDYIVTRDSVDAAVHIYEKITGKIAALSSHPNRCRIVPELKNIGVQRYRELVVPPYGVFFSIEEGTVGIVGVLDRRRGLEELLIERALRL